MGKCIAGGCETKSRANKFCNKHNKQYSKYGYISDTGLYNRNTIIANAEYSEMLIYDKAKTVKAVCKIDHDDALKVKDLKWCLNAKGYIFKNKYGELHRFIIGALPGQVVDHANGDKLDNRKSNLRFCTGWQNSQNMKTPKNSTSGFKGVNWQKGPDKWMARIYVVGKQTYLGLFESREEAARAYNEAAVKYFGEFARLNCV